MQTLAARKLLLPLVPTANIDRDTLLMSEPNKLQRCIIAGWFDGRYCKFPFPREVDPLFISFHLNEARLPTYYDNVFEQANGSLPCKTLLTPSNVHYLKQYEPIGCRDFHTQSLLQKAGITTYFSGCITLTLSPNVNEMEATKTNEILLVDVEDTSRVPPEVLSRCVRLTHHLPRNPPLTHQQKMVKAEALLTRYRRAKCIITSRLHVLPARANKPFPTPVIFLTPTAEEDVRFGGLLPFFTKVLRPGDVWDFDIDDIEEIDRKQLDLARLNDVQHLIRNCVRRWIEKPFASTPPTLWIAPARPSISIFTACMNREQHLLQSLPTWLAIHPDEIVIVFWGPEHLPPKLKELIAKHSQIIRVIRVINVTRWILSRAFNLAAQFTTKPNLLKLDCDTLLHKDFLHYHSLYANTFYTGNWKKAKNENAMHLNGVFYLRSQDYWNVGGLSEFLKNYGWDDSDLSFRLQRIGLKQLDFHPDMMEHIPHGNRLSNQPNVTSETKSITSNWELAHHLPWGPECPLSRFRFVQYSYHESVCMWVCSVSATEIEPGAQDEKVTKKQEPSQNAPTVPNAPQIELSKSTNINQTELPKTTSTQVQTQTQTETQTQKPTIQTELTTLMQPENAIPISTSTKTTPTLIPTMIPTSNPTQKVAETSPNTLLLHTQLTPNQSSKTSCTRPQVFSQTEECVFDLTPICGLGNRLRTLAACWNIAKGLNRPLKVRWIPDEHCEARFEELFLVPENTSICEEPLSATTQRVEIEEQSPSLFNDPLEYKGRDICVVSARVIKSKHTEWFKECNFLSSRLFLTQDLQNQLMDLLLTYDFPNMVGVHIRMGQDGAKYVFDDVSNYDENSKNSVARWRAAAHWKNFEREMKRLIQRDPKQQFFVCADNDDAQTCLQQSMPSNVITFHRSLFDRSRKQVQDALLEAMALSHTKLFLGSNWSTFSELVIRFAKKGFQSRMAGVHF
jgi:hypothetical protein